MLHYHFLSKRTRKSERAVLIYIPKKKKKNQRYVEERVRCSQTVIFRELKEYTVPMGQQGSFHIAIFPEKKLPFRRFSQMSSYI